MLFFELFPAFMTVVVVIVGLRLFVADREARRDARALDREEG